MLYEDKSFHGSSLDSESSSLASTIYSANHSPFKDYNMRSGDHYNEEEMNNSNCSVESKEDYQYDSYKSQKQSDIRYLMEAEEELQAIWAANQMPKKSSIKTIVIQNNQKLNGSAAIQTEQLIQEEIELSKSWPQVMPERPKNPICRDSFFQQDLYNNSYENYQDSKQFNHMYDDQCDHYNNDYLINADYFYQQDQQPYDNTQNALICFSNQLLDYTYLDKFQNL